MLERKEIVLPKVSNLSDIILYREYKDVGNSKWALFFCNIEEKKVKEHMYINIEMKRRKKR